MLNLPTLGQTQHALESVNEIPVRKSQRWQYIDVHCRRQALLWWARLILQFDNLKNAHTRHWLLFYFVHWCILITLNNIYVCQMNKEVLVKRDREMSERTVKWCQNQTWPFFFFFYNFYKGFSFQNMLIIKTTLLCSVFPPLLKSAHLLKTQVGFDLSTTFEV
jgi:hypothetical protein